MGERERHRRTSGGYSPSPGVRPLFAVVPTKGRPCLRDCVAAVSPQVDRVIAVVNSGYAGTDLGNAYVIRDRDPEPNISRWWNIGLDTADRLSREVLEEGEEDSPVPHDVLVINDDVIMAPGSVERLRTGMRAYGAALASPGPPGIFHLPTPDRIAGWCFMIRSEASLRADESMAWWFGDNDLDWSARAQGGTLLVPGVDHEHLHPNAYTNDEPALGEQAGRDMERFLDKWGLMPW